MVDSFVTYQLFKHFYKNNILKTFICKTFSLDDVFRSKNNIYMYIYIREREKEKERKREGTSEKERMGHRLYVYTNVCVQSLNMYT